MFEKKIVISVNIKGALKKEHRTEVVKVGEDFETKQFQFTLQTICP